MPGGRGQGAPGDGIRFSGSGWWPSYAGVTSRGGRGGARRQPALPRSAGHRRCPGDMMIDWVSPPWGMRPLSLIRPSAGPLEAGSG